MLRLIDHQHGIGVQRDQAAQEGVQRVEQFLRGHVRELPGFHMVARDHAELLEDSREQIGVTGNRIEHARGERRMVAHALESRFVSRMAIDAGSVVRCRALTDTESGYALVGTSMMPAGGTFFLKMAAPSNPPSVEKTAPTHNHIMNAMMRPIRKKAAFPPSRPYRSNMSRMSGGMLPAMSSRRCMRARSIGPTIRLIGIDSATCTTAPIRPASRPTSAPSAGVIGVG